MSLTRYAGVPLFPSIPVNRNGLLKADRLKAVGLDPADGAKLTPTPETEESRHLFRGREVEKVNAMKREGGVQAIGEATGCDRKRRQKPLAVNARANSYATECLARVVYDGWFARVVVSLAHAVHCVIWVGAHFGHTSDRAVADGTAVVP